MTTPNDMAAEEAERDIRVAIWNAGRNGGMGQDLSQAFIRRAMDEPTMKRALACLTSTRSPVLSDWQPIETAPKDGTAILFARGTAIGFGNITRTNFDGMELESFNIAWQEDGRISLPCNDNRKPSHWQPLPPPPAVEHLALVGEGRSHE